MDVINVIKERRSINYFDAERDIANEKIMEILELANLSPSSFNLQPWKVIVVTEPERKKVLRQCAMNQPKVEEASVVLIMVADPKGVEENRDRVLDSWQELGYMKPEMREMNTGLMKNLYGTEDSLRRISFAVKNTALYSMNVMVVAKGLGIDTHPMDGFDEDCIKREFNIPDDKIIPMLIAVGYLKPGITLLPRSFRRSIKEFVKFEKY